ncbi:MAG TPA: cupin domain-containing protein [Bryobacteraceae bacterium]|jgi:quercetin dioxygenase-like cupin family protein
MTKTEPQHVRWSDVPTEAMNPLLDRQFVVGNQIMISRLTLKKGSIVPEHSHYHEQVSQVLSGSLQFHIDGKEVVVRAGELLFIPPHVPHSVLTLEDSVAVDTFTPPREDWINKTDQYLRG